MVNMLSVPMWVSVHVCAHMSVHTCVHVNCHFYMPYNALGNILSTFVRRCTVSSVPSLYISTFYYNREIIHHTVQYIITSMTQCYWCKLPDLT